MTEKFFPQNNENSSEQRGLEKILMILELENPTEKLNSQDAIKLINAGKFEDLSLGLYGNRFEKLDAEVALKLLDLGKVEDVDYYISVFEHNKILGDKLIERGQFRTILQGDLDSFKINHDYFIDKMIEAGMGQELVDHMIENNDGSIVVDHPDRFFEHINNETLQYLKMSGKKEDSQHVYKFRKEYSLEEISNNYNLFRAKAWNKEGVLQDEDKKAFLDLLEISDEKLVGNLFQGTPKEHLHFIVPEILKMLRVTKYSSDTFRGEYLEQIINDASKYGSQGVNSLQHFHQMAQSIYEPEIEQDLKLTLSEARGFEQTSDLVEKLEKQGPFKNYTIFKKYDELCEILKQRDVLEKLQKLKVEGKEKQYQFFSKLAFHPGSKIPMQTVFQFMENPERFLDVGDDHSGEAHERKKPSNYTQFDYLDISAEDLRDALIEGTLDKLQYFKPFEAQYSIPNSEYLSEVLKMELDEALGSFQKKIKGTAKNPGKLFQMTQQVLKKYGKEYKDLARDLPFMNNEMKNDLEQVLFNKDFGIKDTRKFNDYLVKIHPKSAPEGHLAGNDTACCMPFGSGKNNVYMYNLGCSILTVQRKVGDKYRTIAQSVLTPDVDIHHNISELVKQVQSETLLSKIITDDLTQKKKVILTADNIEVAPNADSYKRVIEKIYTDFISKYVNEINSTDLEKEKMLIGKGYSDLDFSRAENIDNTFIPITPVAYSDNYGEQVYELALLEKSKIIPPPSYGSLEKSEKQFIDPDLPKGVSYLTAHDTLRVSYMEGKVYAENESLVQHIHRIGNELTAKDINNNFKNRSDLSLKIEDEKGAMLGYMIAYEGAEKNYDHGDIDDETKVSLGEKVIYISDLAADTARSKIAGGRLINAFGKLINREYLQKGNPLPIVAKARENTSYKIIQKHLSELGQEYGYRFELEENGSYESGGETMYQIKLKPVKI